MRSRRSKLGQQDIFDEQEKWLEANKFEVYSSSLSKEHMHKILGMSVPEYFASLAFQL